MNGEGSGARSTMERALLAIRELRARVRQLEDQGSEPIAIIGVGCRLPPEVNSAADFWALLAGGFDAVRPPPTSRVDLAPAALRDPDRPSRAFQRDGAYLSSIDRFDAGFFGIAPREAIALDPQQRILLETSHDALEDAGLPLHSLAGSATGVFVGAGTEDYAQFGLRSGSRDGNDAYAFTGSDISLAAGRVAYSFDLQGPALVVDTACSSSLVALHLAMQSLRRGESSLALVGGVSLILNWEIGVSLCRAKALSPDGRCKTFDAAADGYGRGEGCAVLVLKRWSDARRDGDRVLSLILGSAVNQDGASSGLTAPNGVAQQSLLRAALADARLEPKDVNYVEAHGTGTPLGDPIEVSSLGAVLSEGRTAENQLLLGSVKTQIGHLEAAAGIAGVLKVALALKYESLPATLHHRTLNPLLELESIPAAVVAAARPWPRSARRRVAGVSSFGISGTNAHALLAEAPISEVERSPGVLMAARGGSMFVLSARSEAARRELIERYRAWLSEKGRNVDLDELCREASQRRSRYAFRAAVAAETTTDLLDALGAFCAGEPSPRLSLGEGPPSNVGPVFVFDGQGGQWARMGAGLLDGSDAARRALEIFDGVVRAEAGWSLLELLRDSNDAWLGASDRAQPALTAVQVALTEHWRSWGVTPSVVVGHSAGEVAAAFAAGVLSIEDSARVAIHRGRLMQRMMGTGAMATIDVPSAELEAEVARSNGEVSIAAVNAPSTTVISGTAAAVAGVVNRAESRGVRTHRIAVDLPAHSARMDPILGELVEALCAIRPNAPSVQLWSTSRGERIRDASCGAAYWAGNVRDVVQFAKVIGQLLAQGARTFIDIGPHPILALPISQCAEAAGVTVNVIASLRRETREVACLLGSLSALHACGQPLDFLRLFGEGSRAAFDLPSHPWLRERFWREAPASLPAESSVCSAKDDAATSTLLHRVEWIQEPVTATETELGGATGPWVILADRAGLGRAVAGELRARGAEVSLVFLGAGSPVDAHEHFVELTTDHDLWRALRSTLCARGAAVDPRLLVLWDLDLGAIEERFGLSSAEACARPWQSASRLVTALARLAGHAPRTWVATRGSQSVGGRGGDRVLQAMAWALWGSVAFEHPEQTVVRIDLDPVPNDTRDVTTLMSELGRGEPAGDAVAYRGTARNSPRLVPVSVDVEPLCLRRDATYLITGGLGSLGLGLAETLFARGAQHLALIGRRSPDPGALARIEQLTRSGAVVRTIAADVSEPVAVAELLQEVSNSLPPLRGIVHAAGVLDDGLITGLSDQRFLQVVAPKVTGAFNLHALTACYALDFFVLFSSVAGTLCPAGQANYAAANAGLDALARKRAAAGLPALSIAWGPWNDGGMVSALSVTHRDRLASRGLSSLDASTGHDLAMSLLGCREPHLVAMPIGDRAALARGFAHVDGRPCAMLSGYATPADAAPKRGVLLEALRASPRAQRQAVIEEAIARCVGSTLGLAGQLRFDVPFRQLGMDSLMAVVVRNSLATALERRLPATILFDYPCVSALASELVRAVDQDEGIGSLSVSGSSTRDDLQLLADLADSELAHELLFANISLEEGMQQ